jgi:TonB family protein
MIKFPSPILFLLIAAALSFAQNPKVGGTRKVVISNDMTHGSATLLPEPAYPPAASAVGVYGTVVVKILVGESGNVEKASVVSGHPLLRAAAVSAALKAKFKPATLNGNPLRGFSEIRYNFHSGLVTASAVKENAADTAELPLGNLNEKARLLPMPKLIGVTYPSTANAVTVNIKIDLQKGTVISAEAVSGHALIRASAEAAVRRAVFEPVLKDFRTIYGTGSIIYKPTDFNTAAKVNKKPKGLLIQTNRVLNDRTIFLPKPDGVSSGEKFITGRVEVAVLVPATGGGILIANAFSGPYELREAAEKAAMGVKFSNVFITGAFVYVTGTIVYNFKENGKVE